MKQCQFIRTNNEAGSIFVPMPNSWERHQWRKVILEKSVLLLEECCGASSPMNTKLWFLLKRTEYFVRKRKNEL